MSLEHIASATLVAVEAGKIPATAESEVREMIDNCDLRWVSKANCTPAPSRPNASVAA